MAPKGQVLFIHKNIKSKTLSRSDGAEKSRIFSHVQRPSHPRLPNRSSEGSTSSSDGSQIAVTGGSGEDRQVEPLAPRRKARSSSKPSRKTRALEPQDPEPIHAVLTMSLAQFQLLRSAPSAMTEYMQTTLDFYSSVVINRIFPSKTLAAASRSCTLSYATQDPIALNALLCTTSGQLYKHFGDEKHAYHAMYFKGQAIRHLQEELSRPGIQSIRLSTLYAVSLLLWVECIYGDMNAIATHLRGLKQLTQLVKGFEESPLPVMSTILSCAFYCSAMQGAQPTLQPPSSPSHSNSPNPGPSDTMSINNDEEDAPTKPARGFFQPSNATILGPQLLRIIASRRRFIEFRDACLSGICGDACPASSYAEIEQLYHTQLQTDYELLTMPFTHNNNNDDDDDALPPSRNAVRLALYIHLQPIIAVAPPSAAFCRSMIRPLKAALDDADLTGAFWEDSQDLLLWVLFVAAQICYGQIEWPWLVSHIARLAVALDLTGRAAMQGVLERFYFDPVSCGTTLELVWRDVRVVMRGSLGCGGSVGW